MPKIYDENGIAIEIDEATYFSLEDLPGEEWKDIFYFDEKKGEVIDYRGVYQISNKGRVKSLLRYNRFGRIIEEKILKQDSSNRIGLSLNRKMIVTNVIGLLKEHFSNGVIGYSTGKSKKVICITTGKIYDSPKTSYKETGVDPGLISEVCRHKKLYSGRLIDGKIISDGKKYRNQGIPLIWRYLEDVVYEG